MPKATSLGATLENKLGVTAELIPGNNGIFDVAVDGKIIYSKHQTGRFPEDQEIVDLLSESSK